MQVFVDTWQKGQVVKAHRVWITFSDSFDVLAC